MKAEAKHRLNAFLTQLKARRAAPGAQDSAAPTGTAPAAAAGTGSPAAAPASDGVGQQFAPAQEQVADEQLQGIQQQPDGMQHLLPAASPLKADAHAAVAASAQQHIAQQQEQLQQQQEQLGEAPDQQDASALAAAVDQSTMAAAAAGAHGQQPLHQQEQLEQDLQVQPPTMLLDTQEGGLAAPLARQQAAQQVGVQQAQHSMQQLVGGHQQQQPGAEQGPAAGRPSQQDVVMQPVEQGEAGAQLLQNQGTDGQVGTVGQQQQQQQQQGMPTGALDAAALADIIDLTAEDLEGGGDAAGGMQWPFAASPSLPHAGAAAGVAGAVPGSAAAAGWGGVLRGAVTRAANLLASFLGGQVAQAGLTNDDISCLKAVATQSTDAGERQQATTALQQLLHVAQSVHQQQQQQQRYAALAQQQLLLQQQQQGGRMAPIVTTGGGWAAPGQPQQAQQAQQQQQLGYSIVGLGRAAAAANGLGAGGSGSAGAGPSGAAVVAGAGYAPLPFRVDKERALKAAMEGLETAGTGNEERQPPPGVLLTPLLRHQRMALAWMCKREAAGQEPIGGILADDQGLGKTVSTIAVIVTNRPSARDQGRPSGMAKGPTAASSNSLAAQQQQQRQPGRKRQRSASTPEACAPSKSQGGSSAGSSSDEYPTSSDEDEDEEGGTDSSSGEEDGGAEVAGQQQQQQQQGGGGSALKAGGAAARGASVGPSSSGEVVCVDGASPAQSKLDADASRLMGGTLVVCPTTVLHQWAQEIRSKVNPNAGISVHIYHGKGKAVGSRTLSHYSVVLTTYQTMALEAPKRDAVAGGKKKSAMVVGSAAAPAVASASAAAAAAAAAGVAFDDDFIDLLSDSEEQDAAAAAAPGQPASKRQKAAAGAKAAAAAAAADKAKGGPLYDIMWHRVVLDEAQCIKNPRTLAAHAAWSLKARARWCLSGTPLQNTLDDLFSYFRFLKYAPYSKKESFNELLRDPIASGGVAAQRGFVRLRAVLKGVMLRRTKQSKLDGQPVIDLPAREQRLMKTKLSPAEREFYNRLKQEASVEFRRLQQQEGGVGQHYVGVLWQLLRLRQACNHPSLVKGAEGLVQHHPVPTAELAAARKLAPQLRAQLAELLTPARLTPCALCCDMPEDAVVTVCGHVFCAQCVATEFGNAGHGAAEAELAFHCPTCKHVLNKHDAFSPQALAAAADASNGQQQQQQQGAPGSSLQQQQQAGNAPAQAGGSPMRWGSSAKLDALMGLLRTLRDQGVAAEVEAKQQRSVLTSGRSLSNARLAAALGGGGGSSRLPSRGAGAGGRGVGAGASRGASPRPMEKMIVFSQWTAMLDLAEAPMRREGFDFRRLDGTMSLKARQQAIEDFSRRPEVVVMLVSLKAASLGVNLVSANHVVLMDLWYNPTVEEQAIDRAHRIGQTKAVHVTRITIEDSIEDQILKLQERKRATIAQAFDEGTGAGGLAAFSSRLTQEELRELFEDVAPP